MSNSKYSNLIELIANQERKKTDSSTIQIEFDSIELKSEEVPVTKEKKKKIKKEITEKEISPKIDETKLNQSPQSVTEYPQEENKEDDTASELVENQAFLEKDNLKKKLKTTEHELSEMRKASLQIAQELVQKEAQIEEVNQDLRLNHVPKEEYTATKNKLIEEKNKIEREKEMLEESVHKLKDEVKQVQLSADEKDLLLIQADQKQADSEKEKGNLQKIIEDLKTEARKTVLPRLYLVTSTRSNIGRSFYSIYLANALVQNRRTILIDFAKKNKINLGEFFMNENESENLKYFNFIEQLSKNKATMENARKILPNLYVATNSMILNKNYLEALNVENAVQNIRTFLKESDVVIDLDLSNEALAEALMEINQVEKILVLQNDLYSIHKSIDNLNLPQKRHYQDWKVVFNKCGKKITQNKIEILESRISISKIDYLQEYARKEMLTYKYNNKILELFESGKEKLCTNF